MIIWALLALCAGIAIGAMLSRRAVPAPAAAPTVTHETPELAAKADRSADFELLAKSTSEGAIVLDSRGRISQVNEGAQAVFDFTADRVVGRALIEAVPNYELDRQVGAALKGQSWRGALTIPRSAGERTIAAGVYPLSDGGAFVLARDETRLVDLERARREFISNVAHELRTPLAGIKLMVETCVYSPEDLELPGIFMPQIANEIDRLVKLVEDLLELARAEGGRMRLRRQEIDLARHAAGAVHVFVERAHNADVELILDTDQSAVVDVDPDRVTQLIINLVENALRHTPPGGAISVEVSDHPGYAELVVSDTGIGIPFKDLPHIFERFYVVDRSRAREATGIGLGLAIVKGIMEAHEGTIVAESELGKGAKFIARFPKHTDPKSSEA